MKIRGFAALLLLMLSAAGAGAQSLGATGDYYTVAPDYRYCPTPMCGGWWLTKVNQYSSISEALLNSSILPVTPNPIHVSRIDYSQLGLTQQQIAAFQRDIYLGRAFIRGVLRPYTVGQYNLQNLAATGTWEAANDQLALGPYLLVKSNPVFCFVSPCPNYSVQALNTDYRTVADQLNLNRASLTDRQTNEAWNEVNDAGLVLTGVGYTVTGPGGTGLGISATRVFLAFPSPLNSM